MQRSQNRRYDVNGKTIDVPCDVEIYYCDKDSEPELLPHSVFGDRWIHESSQQEKDDLIQMVNERHLSMQRIQALVENVYHDITTGA